MPGPELVLGLVPGPALGQPGLVDTDSDRRIPDRVGLRRNRTLPQSTETLRSEERMECA